MRSEKQRLHLERLAISRKGTHLSQEQKDKISRANKGNPSFWKGKKLPEAARLKMSLAKRGFSPIPKGSKLTEKHRQSISKFHADVSGPNNPNWKGGVTYEYRLFRKSASYQRWRKAVLTRDNYTCTQCGDKEDLHVDHIEPFALHPALRLDMNNGRVLCAPCHRATPTYGRRLSCA